MVKPVAAKSQPSLASFTAKRMVPHIKSMSTILKTISDGVLGRTGPTKKPNIKAKLKIINCHFTTSPSSIKWSGF